MKVALLSFAFEQYCVPLANSLTREAQVELFLSAAEAAPYIEALDPAVTFRPFDKPRLRQPIHQLRMIRNIVEQIRLFNPDVVHLQQGHFWFNLGLFLLRQWPLVLTIHETKSHVGDKESLKTPRHVERIGFARANHVIVHSTYVRQSVVKELGIPSQRVHTIPLTLPLPEVKNTATSSDEDIVLFFGRIWEYKGLEFLIRAEPLITSRVPGAKIVIAGKGEDFSRYRKLMAHPENFIVYNDHVSDDALAGLFARARVVALPYVAASQSGVIPVAYMHSRPVVATAVGALQEMVDDGHTGYLVPPRNVEALADRIVHLLTNRDLSVRMGENGKKKMQTECSLNRIAQQTLGVYEAALRTASVPA